MPLLNSAVLGVFYKLSDADRLALCQWIAKACEKSYRRGFHHGHERNYPVTVDVLDWRFNVPLSRSPSPHGSYNDDSLRRHAFEVSLPVHASNPEVAHVR